MGLTTVALADGDIDDKEFDALITELKDALSYKDPLVREVLMTIVMDLKGVLGAYMADSRDVLGGLHEVAEVLQNNSTDDQAQAFKGSMLVIGRKIAEASGKTLFKRNPVSDEEQNAMVMAAMAMQIKV